MIRRSVLCFALVVLCAAGLAAQTLTVWDFKYSEVNPGGAQAPMKQIDALFQQKNPGVTINHVAQPLEPQYYQIIQAAATANQGPDVAMFHPGAREYGFGDVLVDLGPYIQDVKGQFTAASIAMVSMNGQVGQPIKLLPMTMQGFGIYYNKAYFRKAGLNPDQPPKTAEQFLAACAKLKAAGFVPVTVGQTYTIDFLIRCLVANAWGPNVGGLKDGSVTYKDPIFKQSVEFVKTLVDKGYLEKDGFSRPYFMDGIDKFAAGNGGMFVGLLSDVGNWKAFSDKLGADNVGYFPTVNLPGSKYKDVQVAQGAGIGYGVMTWSSNQKLAAAYVKFATTGDGARIYASMTGALSPNTAVGGSGSDYPALKTIQ
ncbi:MAG TPA: extracellular solute-binding protein, partial [Spirochaetia bacterium]|nr:extracellular solute-binding protein [Spirochaetia bacterium]